MRNFLSLSIVLLASISAFAENVASNYNALADKFEKQGESTESISLYIENDFRFSDRYYTNGLKLLYTGLGDDFYTSKAQFAFLRLFVEDDSETQAWQTASLGQNMYVSSSISEANPPSWDRPYAGWLYLNAGAHIAKKNSLDSFSITMGVVGPLSFAEQTQKFYHSIIDAETPMGWDKQINNEFGFMVSYSHSQRFFRHDFSSNFSTDIVGSLGVDLGNVLMQGTARGFIRFGFNLPYDFSPTRIDYDSSNDVRWIPPSGSPDWHCFMYAGGAFRAVGQNIFLNGNTFKKSVSVTPEWAVYEAMAGVSTRYKNFQLDLNWTLQTAEFTTQAYQPFMFWSLSATVFF